MEIIDRAHRFARLLRDREEDIIRVLLKYESYPVACDEMIRSLHCLENLHAERDYLSGGTIKAASTFFPLNLPLYSLVLFALVPSFVSKKVFVRPPLLMAPILAELFALLEIETHFPGVYQIAVERGAFLEAYASVSDVVLFTGRYNNAVKIQKSCRNALFLYNGAGVNPFLITPSADLDRAVEKVVEARTFNSGQDCAGPDSILVHEAALGPFLDRLTARLSTLRVGDYADRAVQIGRLNDTSDLCEMGRFLGVNHENIVYGGTIDYKRAIVHPTVLQTRLTETQNFLELFSPVFYVSSYAHDDELDLFFQKDRYLDYAMYVSVFGETDYESKIRNSVILKNRSILDVEEGNKPYGGYGPKANYIISRGKTHVRPLLISREIAAWLGEDPAGSRVRLPQERPRRAGAPVPGGQPGRLGGETGLSLAGLSPAA